MVSPARARIAHLAEELRGAVGSNLVSLVLYGSSARGDFVEGVSDINFLVVVRQDPTLVLERLRPLWQRWHRRGLAVPLVVEESFLRRAADVFPMELMEIRERHELLAGEDLLSRLPIDAAHLRHQLEFELRSKWLKLGSLYVQAGALGRELGQVLLEAAKSFAILMRHLLRLGGHPPPDCYSEVVQRFEAAFGVALPATRTLLDVRQRQLRWPQRPAELFRGFLEEMRRVVDLADGLLIERNGKT